MTNTVALDIFRDDPKLEEHLEIIKKRTKLMDVEMVNLAKELLTVSLYTEKPKVVIQNCKLAVSLAASDAHCLNISLFLKSDKKSRIGETTWRTLLDDVQGAAVKLVKEIKFDKGKTQAAASYSVTDAWEVSSKDLPVSFMTLLAAARVIVNQEIDMLKEEALSNIAYIEALATG